MKYKFSLAILFIALIVVGAYYFIPGAEGEVKPYYSGDAIVFKGSLYVGSTNTGKFELFRLENNHLVRKFVKQSSDSRIDNNFFKDVVFIERSGRLYTYVINGRYIYKYWINNPSDPELIEKKKHNDGDEFIGIGLAGDNIFTSGNKGVKIWTQDLVNINAYSLYTDYSNNIAISETDDYIVWTEDDEFEVIDTYYRDASLTKDLDIIENHGRKVYYDHINGYSYVVDDERLRQFSLEGERMVFKHISNLGYDVDGVVGRNFVFFTDGVGIVKSRTSDLKPVDWLFTTSLGGGNGWAMGLRVVADGQWEKVVVFNGTSILVLDGNLNEIDTYEAREVADEPEDEWPWLWVDKNLGNEGTRVSVHGGGFFRYEDIEITLGREKWTTSTDHDGNFSKDITVPKYKKGITDIKALGEDSERTYSTTFEIY